MQGFRQLIILINHQANEIRDISLEIQKGLVYFGFQSAFMNTDTRSLNTLNDIRKMMEKSSRFISLSGWSGVAAGICAMSGAYIAYRILGSYNAKGIFDAGAQEHLKLSLIGIAASVFAAAFITAFLFTYLRSRQEGIVIWGSAARRLLWNTMLPMIAGGVLIFRLIYIDNYALIAPCALIFYGLALINGSKYTLGEVRYLGYLEIILGIVNLWYPGQWLLLWTTGFGVLHIVYGIVMWSRYERNTKMQAV